MTHLPRGITEPEGTEGKIRSLLMELKLYYGKKSKLLPQTEIHLSGQLMIISFAMKMNLKKKAL